MEEESDSAGPVFYRNAIGHPKLGQMWPEALREKLNSLNSNHTSDYISLEDVPTVVKPIQLKMCLQDQRTP